MASKTYKTQALVLKKTKLSEKDLIVTMLDETGCRIKVVAKGARRPGGSHGARVELFSLVDAFIAKGRNLDVLTESRLATPGSTEPLTLEQVTCASPIAELLDLLSLPDLAEPRLFSMASAAFALIKESDEETALKICSASLWKIMAQSGFRPQLEACLSCNKSLDSLGDTVRFSSHGGGVICESCNASVESQRMDTNIISWVAYFLNQRFSDIAVCEIDKTSLQTVLSLGRTWITTHVGKDLKSLNFLFASDIV